MSRLVIRPYGRYDAVDLQRLTKPLALVFTADEEIGLIGAKRLAEARAFQPRYAIVGEPTSLRPMRGAGTRGTETRRGVTSERP